MRQLQATESSCISGEAKTVSLTLVSAGVSELAAGLSENLSFSAGG